QGRAPADARLTVRRSGAGQGLSVPPADQAAAVDLRDPAQDAGLFRCLARHPEDALATELDQSSERGQSADEPDQERAELRSSAMSTGTVAAPTATPRRRRARQTDRAKAERRLGLTLVAPAVI